MHDGLVKLHGVELREILECSIVVLIVDGRTEESASGAKAKTGLGVLEV